MLDLPTYILVLGSVYALSLLIFTVIFYVNWIRLSKQVNKFLRYGFIAAGIFLAFEILIIFLEPLVLEEMPLALTIPMDLFEALTIVAFTIVGLHYARQRNIPILPIIAPKLEVTLVQEETQGQVTTNINIQSYHSESPFQESLSEEITTQPVSNQQYVESESNIRQSEFSRFAWLKSVIAMVTGFTVFTVILFRLTGAETSPFFEDIANEILTSETVSLAFLLLVVQAAFIEEITFRLAIQNYLSFVFGKTKTAAWIAIVISSSLWTIAHPGMMTPEWAKFLQVFVFGLGLGWLNNKYGIEACISVHVLFNGIVFVRLYLFG